MKKRHLLLLLTVVGLCACTPNVPSFSSQSSVVTSSDISSSSTSSSSTSTSTSTSTSSSSSSSSTSEDPGEYYTGYYSSINKSWTGTKLLTALQTLNDQKFGKNIGYDNMWNYFKYTDYDPKNTSNYIGFYSGESLPRSSMNKEHVWPKSHGGGTVEGDIHMVRPTDSKDNSSRGNSFYVEGKADSSSGWDPLAQNSSWPAFYRGAAARIIFYCIVKNPKLGLYEADYHKTSNANPDYLMGRKSTLLKWNDMYDVDASEIRRNDAIETKTPQKNRNPFIDHPEFATKIWG